MYAVSFIDGISTDVNVITFGEDEKPKMREHIAGILDIWNLQYEMFNEDQIIPYHGAKKLYLSGDDNSIFLLVSKISIVI